MMESSFLERMNTLLANGEVCVCVCARARACVRACLRLMVSEWRGPYRCGGGRICRFDGWR